MTFNKYNGPEFMQPYFYDSPQELNSLLPEHNNVHQGIQCICGHKELRISKRAGYPTIFAHCESCGRDFKVYQNGDYPAGYIADNPEEPLESIICSCGGVIFQVAVGYEYPGDEVDSTDITWFTMVGKCSNCGTKQELFTDETA